MVAPLLRTRNEGKAGIGVGIEERRSSCYLPIEVVERILPLIHFFTPHPDS